MKPEPYIEWRAQGMDDPIERLLYLQLAMEDSTPLAPARPTWKRLSFGALVIVAFAFILPTPKVVSDVAPTASRVNQFPGASSDKRPESFVNVWLVEDKPEHEIFSNGLRIDNTFMVSNGKRFYQVLDRKNGLQVVQDWKSQPIGIVYHTTESSLLPFEVDQNENLKRLAQSLLGNLRDNRSYNFVIDRFGRVFRVVDETAAANHAGNSIWADEDWVYLNLNNSFIAIAFETQTLPGELSPAINAAQAHSGRMLTEMLRNKYKIPAENCVTHAQVSVNPSNMRIGWHTDWASGFPFEEMGLADNYDLTLPSLVEFGFEYDDVFRKAVGPVLWKGIERGERRFMREAVAQKRSLAEHRQAVQERYRKLYSALKLTGAMEEAPETTNTAKN